MTYYEALIDFCRNRRRMDIRRGRAARGALPVRLSNEVWRARDVQQFRERAWERVIFRFMLACVYPTHPLFRWPPVSAAEWHRLTARGSERPAASSEG